MSSLNIVLAVLLLLSLHVQLYKATRLLPEDLTTDLSLQSLQRGTIPPSDGSGCTNIPGSGGPSCPLVNEMHYAGNGLPADTAFPRHAVPFRVATNQSWSSPLYSILIPWIQKFKTWSSGCLCSLHLLKLFERISDARPHHRSWKTPIIMGSSILLFLQLYQQHNLVKYTPDIFFLFSVKRKLYMFGK
jgi:hypothetical protein